MARRSIFIHSGNGSLRDLRRHPAIAFRPGPTGPERTAARPLPSLGPTHEEHTAERERLAIVSRCIARLEWTRLRFVEDLPERDIAEPDRPLSDESRAQLKAHTQAIRQRPRGTRVMPTHGVSP